jgi:hypothetical protein
LNDYFEELDEVRQELEEFKLNALLDLEKSIEKAKSSIQITEILSTEKKPSNSTLNIF